MSESFWVKLTYKEYVGHYCEMTDAEIVADVRKSIGSFSNDRDDGNDFGAKMVRKANARMNGEAAGASRANGQKGGRPKKLTAAATTREDVDVVSTRESGLLERTTGCNNSQVAHSRKAGDESSDASNGAALKSATACNHYDQETLDKPTISASSPAGAGVNLDSTQTNKRPDASVGNAEWVNTNGSTITRNVSRVACTSATSGQTISATEALEQPGDGGSHMIERTSSSLPSPNPVKPKTDPKPTRKAKAEVKPEEQKYPHGEFENIMLTTKEYIQLTERLDNADGLIAEADQYFEAQPDKKRKYKSHYAMLLNWDRRRKEFEGPKRGYKTAAEKQRDELQKIADYYASKEVVG